MTAETVVPSFRLRPPPIPVDLIPRPRVSSALLATEPGGVCVIAAAPGYGATTAVRQALVGSGDAIRWVGLDESVDDATACNLLYAAVGAAALTTSDVVSALTTISSIWLVIDGLVPHVHVTLAAQIAVIAAAIPASARLIITCHQDLPIPGARHLDESCLAFEPDEAFDLVTMLAGAPDVDEAGTLLSAAQGWGSALVAGAKRLKLNRSIEGWLPDKAAVELLLPWLHALPDACREVLQRTAVLDELGHGPAARILGDDVGPRLQQLQTHHCYVLACDPPRGHTGQWWQRHPLLTVLLRQNADGETLSAHVAAAEWFGERGDIHAAIPHLIAAGRLDTAADLLSQYESALLSTGQAARVVQWYDKLTDAADRRIETLLRTAWGSALARDIPAADTALARVQTEIVQQRARDQEASVLDPHWTRWEHEEAMLRSYLAAFHGDPATVVAAATQAMNDPAPDYVRDSVQLAPLLNARGLFWSGQPQAAAVALEGISDKPYPNDVIRELHLAGLRALVLCANGQVTDAGEIMNRVAAWIAAGGVDPLSIQLFAPGLARAWIALESGDVDACEALAEDLLQRARQVPHICDATWACILLAKVEIARGDYGAAIRQVTQGRALATSQTPDSTLTVPLDQVQALIHIAAGDTVRAERMIRRLPVGDTRALLAARAGLSRQPVLSRRTVEAVVPTTPRTAAERHVLLAGIHARTSRRMAQGHLHEAAAIAARHGLRQVLVPPAGAAAELAAQTAREQGDDALAWLLALPVPTAPDPGARAATLSRGELQLLAILPSRTKNVEIAQRLGVSVNTVKTRLRRLYAKLGAANRDEAIDRARERGLLTPDDETRTEAP